MCLNICQLKSIDMVKWIKLKNTTINQKFYKTVDKKNEIRNKTKNNRNINLFKVSKGRPQENCAFCFVV